MLHFAQHFVFPKRKFLPAAKPTGLLEADSSFFIFLHLLTKFKKLSCLWADLADTLVDGRGRSDGYLATRWRPNWPPGGATRPIFLRC